MPKKYYNFAENFLFGEKIAEQRVELARKYDGEDVTLDELDIKEYVSLRNKWNEILSFNSWKGFASVLGYAYGTYATFCPFQSQLDDFDREISGLTESAMEGL